MPNPNLTGPKGQLYAEPKPSPDENAFQVNNNSEQYYQSPYYKLHKSQVQPIPPARNGVPAYLTLSDFIPKPLTDAIKQAGKITFHAVGDTGAAKSGPHQSAAVSIADEAAVAGAMSNEVQEGGPDWTRFFFSFGDGIYHFREAQDLYYQFY